MHFQKKYFGFTSDSKKARNYFQVWIFLTSDMDSGRSGEKIYRLKKRYTLEDFEKV